MKTYRFKRAIEALRWTDTDDDRELFSAWFERHGFMFETRGPIAQLPHFQTRASGDACDVQVGEWVVWMDGDFGEFRAVTDEEFRDTYEEIA